MRWTCVTGKLWKQEVRKLVICWNGADPSMLSVSITRSITGRSCGGARQLASGRAPYQQLTGCVTGWDATLPSMGPDDGRILSRWPAQAQRVCDARKYSRVLTRSLSVGGNWCL